MTDQTPVTPPADPPVTPPAPDPKPAEKKLLDDLKKEQTKRKELEAKLAEALPYLEKFKTHDEAKALEAQRQAEAAEKDRVAREGRERAIRDEITHGLISQGRKLDRRGIGLVIAGAVAPDSGIALDDEGRVQGVDDYLTTVFSTFAPPAPGEPPKKPAPGLPPPGQPSAGGKFSNVKSFTELLALGSAAVAECHEKEPALYETLRRDQVAGAAHPTRAIPPAAARS